MSNEMEMERLRKKLEHWIEHNREHAESFRREAEYIRKVIENTDKVALLVESAADKMDEATKFLVDALNMAYEEDKNR